MQRRSLLAPSLALANVLLYTYLVSHLNWAGWPVFLVSALFFITSTFFLSWNLGYAYALHRRNGRASASSVASVPSPLPSVSLVVPLYCESISTIKTMIEGFKTLDYPPDKLRLYLFDDTQDPSHRTAVERLCQDPGGSRMEYFTRNGRRGFKAGAINDVVSRITSEYCIILDVDHVPLPDMVKKLVSAKMQSPADFLMFPQYFRNENENSIASTSSLKQLVDYRIERMGRCVTNSAFCVTTNWICETATLRKIGGLDESTVTEDLATGLIAHSKGLRVDMIDARLALGLAPNALGSWRTQQSRWSSGTFDVAKRILPRVWRSLNWHQRLDYTLCITWYLSGLFSFILYLFPIFTALGVRFFSYNSIGEFLVFSLSMVLVTWVLTDYPTYAESKSLRKTIVARAVSLAVSDVYLKALVSALRRKEPSFEVTRKGYRGRPRMMSVLGALKFHLALLGIGVAAAIYSLTMDRSLDAVANAGWIWNNNMWVVISIFYLGRK